MSQQTTFARVTVTGRNKVAAAIASGAIVELTEIAIGDGDQLATGTETALTNELIRKPVSRTGVSTASANQFFVEYLAEANEGPYSITEMAVFDSDGDLFAIARIDPAINKPAPISGNAASAILRFEIAVQDANAVTVLVDPSQFILYADMASIPWVPVLDKDVNVPPSSPIVGDTYLTSDLPTGEWVGLPQHIAQFSEQGWSLTPTPDGHGIGLPSGVLCVKKNGSYAPFSSVATQSEFDNKSPNAAATPEQVHGLLDSFEPDGNLPTVVHIPTSGQWVAPEDLTIDVEMSGGGGSGAAAVESFRGNNGSETSLTIGGALVQRAAGGLGGLGMEAGGVGNTGHNGSSSLVSANDAATISLVGQGSSGSQGGVFRIGNPSFAEFTGSAGFPAEKTIRRYNVKKDDVLSFTIGAAGAGVTVVTGTTPSVTVTSEDATNGYAIIRY